MTLYINPKDLDNAVKEALRFLRAARELNKDLLNNGVGRSGKLNARAWRASLDLSDAVAHMRRRK